MSDKMRWRYGDTNPVIAAVDSTTVIETGDLVWQDTDDAKPASELRVQADEWKPDPTSTIRGALLGPPLEELFSGKFLGVAMQRSHDGDMAPIRVSTTGVFEFECSLKTFELGNLIGAIPNDTGKLQNQAVGPVTDSKFAIGRVTKREPSAASSVLIDIRSTVMTGGVAGSSREGT